MAVKVTKPKRKKPAKLGDIADVKKGIGTKAQKRKVESTLWKRYEAKYPGSTRKTKRKPKKLKMPKLEKWYYSSGKKVAKKVATKTAGKSLARKVVGKLGAPGKAIAGAALLIDYAKMKQKGKKGCGPGMSKVTKNGKSYCTPAKGSRKGRDY